eukprot:ANDGO_00215.mRNA.1 Exosome complex component csl4
MSVVQGTWVTPGEVISASQSGYICGPGAYVRDDKIYASVSGAVQVIVSSAATLSSSLVNAVNAVNAVVTVKNPLNAIPVLPRVGNTVLARIDRIHNRSAHCEILAVENEPLAEPYEGIIRVSDVRATQIDTVQMYESFRPGDVVRATVLSLGTARSFFLGTARNDLGVVMAQDGRLLPLSWREVYDPLTGQREPRKVAKP